MSKNSIKSILFILCLILATVFSALAFTINPNYVILYALSVFYPVYELVKIGKENL